MALRCAWRRAAALPLPSQTVPLLSRGLAIFVPRRNEVPRIPLWINGQAVYEIQQPSKHKGYTHTQTGQLSCEVAYASEREVDQAIEGSWTAFQQWKDVSGWERRNVLQRVLGLLEERLPSFAQALRADVDMSDILVAADHRTARNVVDGASSTAIEIEGHIPATLDNSLALVLRQPFGPVLSIPAFNYPLTLALRSVVYPLACGNTVILKSSIHTPQITSLLHPLFADAGLPDGVLQVLHMGEDAVGERITQVIAHPFVRMMNFTGSVALGRKLAALCGEHLKPSVMELGGKSPAIVMPSADLQLAANNILFGCFFNSGQVCMSTERCLVHEDVARDFELALIDAMSALSSRGEFEHVRPGAVAHLKQTVTSAIDGGARLVHPPTLPSLGPTSTSHPPLIISHPSPTSTLLREESFAPILSLQTFSTIPHLVSLANSHITGLSSSIFTDKYDEALGLARQLESGAVHINGMTIHDEHGLPFGGVKGSGWGRFNGRGAVESFTWMKSVTMGRKGMLPLGAL